LEDYLKTDLKIKERVGLISRIDKEVVESEKEIVNRIPQGKYRFHIITSKGKYLIELVWSQTEKDHLRVSALSIIDSNEIE
jgi:hypothetical protein